jgi:Zn-dependent protease
MIKYIFSLHMLLDNPIFIIAVTIMSIILHEVAHGYMAYIEGDETAYRAGRLTLNPLSHIDVIGSIVVPLFAYMSGGTFFGWAKPVPVNMYNLRGRYGHALVASAGVLTNFALALVTGILFVIFTHTGVLSALFAKALLTIIVVNVSLGMFNLIPIPPFDGMSIIQGLFPKLYINSRLIYNPLYMVVAIVIASVFYGIVSPHIFDLIFRILGV